MSSGEVYFTSAICYCDGIVQPMVPSDAETECPENGLVCPRCGFEVMVSTR